MRAVVRATLTMMTLSGTLLAKPPALPPTPAGIEGVVLARPFTLQAGYEFAWRKEKPLVTEGYILVLKVDPALVYPRQVAEPVLYAGDTTVERVNVGYGSGHVVVIMPGKFADTDLKKTLIWFGTPELPERVTAKTIAAEREKAEKAGLQPQSGASVDAALAKGGARLALKDYDALRREMAPVIKQFAPDETELANNLLAPRVREKSH
jgi:hypothetical protein